MKTLDQLRAEREALDKQIAEAEADERRQAGRENALQIISCIAAFKEAFSFLKAQDGVMSQHWHDLPAQALPREANIAKAWDISETDTSVAKARGRKAVEALKGA